MFQLLLARGKKTGGRGATTSSPLTSLDSKQQIPSNLDRFEVIVPVNGQLNTNEHTVKETGGHCIRSHGNSRITVEHRAKMVVQGCRVKTEDRFNPAPFFPRSI